MKGSIHEHDRIVNETLLLLGREAHHIGRFFSNPTGVAYRDHAWGREWIQYGVKGSGDIWGIIKGGTHLWIEIKSGGATQQENQKDFEKMIIRFGGIYVVARSPEEALDYVFQAAT